MGARARILTAALVGAAVVGCTGETGPGAAGDGDIRVYVASGLTDEVLRVDPRRREAVASIPLDPRRFELDEPHGVAIAPDGRHWYATLSHGAPTLWKYETAGDRLVGRLPLQMAGAARIGFTPDGRRAFIPDYDRSRPGTDGEVAVVELADLQLLRRLRLCPGPHHAEPDPAGARVAVACSLGDEILMLDAATLKTMGRFAVDPERGPPGDPRFKPLNLAWTPDGSRLFVALHLADEVRVFRADGTPAGRVEVGEAPTQIAVTADGSRLVVANRRAGSLSIISLPALRETARVALGAAHPHGVALDPTGRTAFVACEGTTTSAGSLVAVSLETASVEWTLELGAYLLGVAAGAG